MIRKIIFFVLLFIFITSFKIVNATTNKQLILKMQDGIYYTSRGNGNYISNILSFYWIDDEVIYCVEPGVLITDYNYIGELGLENLSYTDAVKEKISLIAYYGYEYPGHQTIKYKMATQALIWENINNSIIEFFTERYGYGDFIDVSFEREEIMRLVNLHHTKPEFNIKKITATLNEEIVLTDTNKILENFEVEDNDTFTIIKDKNKLTLIPKKKGSGEIVLKKKTYDKKTSILYQSVNGNGQKLARLRPSYDTLTIKIPYNIKTSKIYLEKKDYDTKDNKNILGESLKDAVYGIYDVNNNLISKMTTDSTGRASSSDLPFGTYMVKELTPSIGYELDLNTYKVNLTELKPEITLEVYEKVIKRKLVILKVLESLSDNIIVEPNITFDIYQKESNTLYKSITTNQDGLLEIELPYGIYLIKQQNTTTGYELADDIEIVVNQNSPEIIKLTIENKLKEYKLKVIKKDLLTKNEILLPGIKFKIKNLTTNEYLCDTNKLCTYETNEVGEILFPFSVAGTFSLEEVDQKIDGYLYNPEKLIFSTINQTINSENIEISNDLITIDFYNEKVLGSLKIVKFGEKMLINNNSYSYQKIPLLNVKFNLYQESTNELIKVLETNDLGIAFLDNLELGNYYLEEIASSNNHLLDSKLYHFSLNYQDQYTKTILYTLELENYLPKGSLEILKVAKGSNKPLEGALFTIYKEKLDGDEEIYTGYTNFEGKIVLNNLELGNYYIIEKESPLNYQLESKKILVSLVNNQELISIEVFNEALEIKVPNTSLNSNYFKNILAIILLFFGFGLIIKAKSLKN